MAVTERRGRVNQSRRTASAKGKIPASRGLCDTVHASCNPRATQGDSFPPAIHSPAQVRFFSA